MAHDVGEVRSEIAHELAQLVNAAQAIAGKVDAGTHASEAVSTGVRHLSRRASRAQHRAGKAGRHVRNVGHQAAQAGKPAVKAGRRAAKKGAKRVAAAERIAVRQSKRSWPVWAAVALGGVAFAVARMRSTRK